MGDDTGCDQMPGSEEGSAGGGDDVVVGKKNGMQAQPSIGMGQQKTLKKTLRWPKGHPQFFSPATLLDKRCMSYLAFHHVPPNRPLAKTSVAEVSKRVGCCSLQVPLNNLVTRRVHNPEAEAPCNNRQVAKGN